MTSRSSRSFHKLRTTACLLGLLGSLSPASLNAQATGGATPDASPGNVASAGAQGAVSGVGGESFSASLSTGGANYAIPLIVPQGRAGLAPELQLTYASGGGSSSTGFGWTLPQGFIARSRERGAPQFDDRARFHPGEDLLIAADGQELVPVDSQAASARDGGAIPPELAGFQEYRARVESSFSRYFRAPDWTRWVVQQPDGTLLEYGRVLDGPGEMLGDSTRAVQGEPGRPSRWWLTRRSDARGATMYYRYLSDGGEVYLSEIFYNSPASCAASGSAHSTRSCTAPLAQYGARVSLRYEARDDVQTSYALGYAVRSALRVKRVEMTAAGETVGGRRLVHRYHFRYLPGSFHSLLSELVMEGRPDGYDATVGAVVAHVGPAEAELGDAITGPTLPAMRFSYTGQEALAGGVEGFPGVTGALKSTSSFPRKAPSDGRGLFLDVNKDGLVDYVDMDAARYRTSDNRPAVGVYFNGFGGPNDTPGEPGSFSQAVPMGIPAGKAAHLTLQNKELATLDLDGDGGAEFLHMRRAAEYGYYVPVRTGNPQAVSVAEQGYELAYVPVKLPAADADPRIDLARMGSQYRFADVNGDGALDIVTTGDRELDVWLSLDRYPGGVGRFGSASYDDQGSLTLSTAPIRHCLPVASNNAKVRFSDATVRLGDMNGDGFVDLIRLQSGSLQYWPGRGNGAFGTGEVCAGSGLWTNGYVAMLDAPRFPGNRTHNVFLDDADSDGQLDLVSVGSTLNIYYNKSGEAFTRTPVTSNAIRGIRNGETQLSLVDIDASGTGDLVFATSSAWQWLDPVAGVRQRMLERVDNGLGGSVRFEYEGSARDYLRDLKQALSCSGAECNNHYWRDVNGACDAALEQASALCGNRSGSPVLPTVVRATVRSDGFGTYGVGEHAERVEYAYHDPYFDPVKRAFAGFGATHVTRVGDESHPGSTEYSRQFTARRPADVELDRTAENPLLALRGHAYLLERTGADGSQLSTTLRRYVVREWLRGLDGRPIEHARLVQTDAYLYDLGSAPARELSWSAAERELLAAGGGAHAEGELFATTVRLRPAPAVLTRTTTDRVNVLGFSEQERAWGRVLADGSAEAPVVEHTSHALLDAQRWIWRAVETYVTGAGTERLREAVSEYDANGDVVRVRRPVSGGRELAFLGDGRGAAAVPPHPGEEIVSYARDGFGNVIASCGGAAEVAPKSACLRYYQVDYDPAYAQLAVAHRVFTGERELTATTAWDRGASQALRITQADGSSTENGYDGLGRPTFVRLPQVAGCTGSSVPTTRTSYHMTSDPVVEAVSWVETVQETSCTNMGEGAIVQRAYLDGFRRTRAKLTHLGGGRWERSGVIVFDALGKPRHAYATDALEAADPTPADVLALPRTARETTSYDAFGRVHCTRDLAGALSCKTYHALAFDECDPLDHDPESVAYRTCTTVRLDGHLREVDRIERNRKDVASALEIFRLFSSYRADGLRTRLTRAQTSDELPEAATHVVAGRSATRTISYDSQGRRVASSDPDTDGPNGATWRYRYNGVGDLVGVRDPRGCGVNLYYDRAGRELGARYVGCAAATATELPGDVLPAGTVGQDIVPASVPVDARNYFDVYPEWAAPLLSGELDARHSLGRLTAQLDRGQRSAHAYDGRGHVVFTARQLALMPELTESAAPTRFDEQHTYEFRISYDHAGRAHEVDLPRDPDFFPDASGPSVRGHMEFDARGFPQSAYVDIGGRHHAVIDRVDYTVEGLVARIVYGDGHAGRIPTETSFSYDVARRPTGMRSVREPLAAEALGTGSLAGVSVIRDDVYHWDAADNLLAIEDHRVPEEWPLGHKPQSVELRHDALYRVLGAEYSYRQTSDAPPVPSDAATNYRDEQARVRRFDPMAAAAAPRVAGGTDERMVSLTWDYDWLGNLVDSTDDADQFFERSIGRIAHGDGAGAGPSAPTFASNLPTARPQASSELVRGGWLEVELSVGGNVTDLMVFGECRDRSDAQLCWNDTSRPLAGQKARLRESCSCALTQRYEYRWDERNRLVDARRYDGAGGQPATHMRYRYDHQNVRMVKSVTDAEYGERHALYVFADDFERRGLVRSEDGDAYVPSDTHLTESSYLVAGARVVWQAGEPAAGLDGRHRVTVAVGDLLGSTSAVIDLASGALVESRTYHPNGAVETLLAEDVALEPRGFTGKESDEGVGLVYFGERYLIPQLGHWASPDPAQIHHEEGGEALNSYHYVSGNLLQAKDPIGLDKFKVSKNFKGFKWEIGEEQTYAGGKIKLFKAEISVGSEKFIASKIVGLRGETYIEFAQVGVNALGMEGSLGLDGFKLKGTLISGDIKTCVCGIEAKLECGIMFSFTLSWGNEKKVGFGPCELSFGACSTSKINKPNRRAQLLTGMMDLVDQRARLQEKYESAFDDHTYWWRRRGDLQDKYDRLEYQMDNWPVDEDTPEDASYNLGLFELEDTRQQLEGAYKAEEYYSSEMRKYADKIDAIDGKIANKAWEIKVEVAKDK